MRVLLDANVLVAGYAWPGRCREVIEKCVRLHTIVLSDRLQEEVERTLRGKLHLPAKYIEEEIGLLCARSVHMLPAPVPPDACRDPDDLHVLGLAVAAHADCIITGDQDLLVLSRFRGVPILSPSDFARSPT